MYRPLCGQDAKYQTRIEDILRCCYGKPGECDYRVEIPTPVGYPPPISGMKYYKCTFPGEDSE